MLYFWAGSKRPILLKAQLLVYALLHLLEGRHTVDVNAKNLNKWQAGYR